MERLTKVGEDGYVYRINCEISDADAWNKLAHCEDLAEKGLLVGLPCNVGDTVYFIKSMFLYSKSPMRGRVCMLKTFSKNCEFSFHVLMDINNQERVFTNSDIGKTVFLTGKEAEAKLAEMEGENETN